MRKLQMLLVSIACLAGLQGYAQKLVPYRFTHAQPADSSARHQAKWLTDVKHPQAAFLRLFLAGTQLGPQSYLLLEGPDGAQQKLGQQDLKNWSYTSAYFNGDRVKLSLCAAAGEPNTVQINQVQVDEGGAAGKPSPDPRARLGGTSAGVAGSGGVDLQTYPYAAAVGRFTIGTSASYTCFIAANGAIVTNYIKAIGYDGISAYIPPVIEFNIPPYNPNVPFTHAAPEDQYPVRQNRYVGKIVQGTKTPVYQMPYEVMLLEMYDRGSEEVTGGYVYMEALPNSTGKRPGERQQQYFQVTRHPSGPTMEDRPLDAFHYSVHAVNSISRQLQVWHGQAHNSRDWLSWATDEDNFLVYDAGSSRSGTIPHDMQGAPIVYAGSNVAVGIHSERAYGAPALATGFRDDHLRRALSDFFSSSMVYVDRDSHWDTYNGEIDKPYHRVRDGVTHVAAGSTVSIARGTYPETFTISKPVTLQAPVGKVIIGAAAGSSARTAAGPALPGELFTDDPVAFDREEDRPEEAGAPVVSYPNPFSHRTELRYALPEEAAVTVKVYDIIGNEIRTLVQTRQEQGKHTAVWDGRDQAGKPAIASMYVIKLQAGTHTQAVRVIKK